MLKPPNSKYSGNSRQRRIARRKSDRFYKSIDQFNEQIVRPVIEALNKYYEEKSYQEIKKMFLPLEVEKKV